MVIRHLAIASMGEAIRVLGMFPLAPGAQADLIVCMAPTLGIHLQAPDMGNAQALLILFIKARAPLLVLLLPATALVTTITAQLIGPGVHTLEDVMYQ